jgi:hypothetical protein
MMKKLLLSTILGFFTVASFAHGKNDNAQLLVHLKSIRKEMIVIVNSNVSNSVLDDLSLELINQLYNKAKVLHTIVTDEIARPEFDIICNNMLPFEDIIEKFECLPTHRRKSVWVVVNDMSRPQHPVHINKQEMDKLFKLFIPIFKKAHKKYSAIFQPSMDRQTIQNWFDRVLSQILLFPENLDKNWPLLKLIDAKIAELEEQV